MKKESGSQDLDLLHKQLVHALRLPDAALAGDAPDFLKALDLTFVRQLLGVERPWGMEDAFEEGERIVSEVLTASEEGRRLYLASEIDLLRQVKEAGQDHIHRGPFDILEAVFPVKLRGHVVHCIRSGKYREAPLSAAEIKELGFLSGVPVKKVEEVAQSLPVFEASRAEEFLAVYRRLRDSVALALQEHIRATELAQEQVRTERMYSLGTLAEGMAHHFSNLLSIILGYSSMVLDRAEVTGEAADALHKVTEAAQRGRRFTEEILSVAGSREEQEIPCSIHNRLKGTLTLLQPRFSAGTKVETHLDAARDIVMAPPAIIHQIAFNLISNALDSMPSGGALTVATANTKEESDAGPQEFITITVTDTSGIMPKPKVAKGGKADDRGALGGESLGPRLTSIFGLVGQLEGTVTVKSEPGMITRVEVTLPVSTKPESVTKEKKMRRRLAPSLIWVVDDDAVIREMCTRVLSQDGHTVEQAGSGEELEKRLKQASSQPDLIIYDFSMPDINGLELCSKLRASGARVPIILISGFGVEHPDIRKAMKLRKTFFVQKPFSFRELADMVTIAMGETLIEEPAR